MHICIRLKVTKMFMFRSIQSRYLSVYPLTNEKVGPEIYYYIFAYHHPIQTPS